MTSSLDRKIERAKREAEAERLAKGPKLNITAFNKDNHQPDGTVRPAIKTEPELAPKRQLLSAAEMGEAETAAMVALQPESDEAIIEALRPEPNWVQNPVNGAWANLDAPPERRQMHVRTNDGNPPMADMSNVTALISTRELPSAWAYDEPDHMVDALRYAFVGSARKNGKSWWRDWQVYHQLQQQAQQFRDRLLELLQQQGVLISATQLHRAQVAMREPSITSKQFNVAVGHTPPDYREEQSQQFLDLMEDMLKTGTAWTQGGKRIEPKRRYFDEWSSMSAQANMPSGNFGQRTEPEHQDNLNRAKVNMMEAMAGLPPTNFNKIKVRTPHEERKASGTVFVSDEKTFSRQLNEELLKNPGPFARLKL